MQNKYIGLTVIFLLAGCAGTTNIQSAKSRDYVDHPTKLSVIVDMGTDRDNYKAVEVFDNKLTSLMTQCGVEIREYHVPDTPATLAGHQLTMDAAKQAMIGFVPDAVLNISWSRIQTDRYGSTPIGYKMVLTKPNGQLAMTADITPGHDFWGPRQVYANIALGVVGALRQQGVLKECPSAFADN